MMVILVFALSLGKGVYGGVATPAFPPGYSRESYVDQAAQELRQIRFQVDTSARRAPPSAQSQYGVVYDALAEAEQALGELRSAEKTDTAQRRLQFEQSKTKAIRLWRDFKLQSEGAEPAKN